MPLLQATSIEDYFSSSPIKKRKRSPDSHSPGNNDSSPTAAASSDSATDIDNGTRTNPHKWKPRVEYDEVQVSQLKPGFAGVRFVVKVVNVFEQGMKGAQGSRSNGNGSGNGARGCLKILGKGADGGVLMVHLYYADVPYDIGLGSVVTVWTPYISRVREEEKGGAEGAGAAATTATLGAGAGDGSAPISRSGYSAPSGSGAELMTSIFPERDGKCHVRIHRGEDANGLCRGVGGEGKVESLVGFMERMGRGGGTGGSGRVLVFVKAIGEVVTYTNKQGRPTQKLDIGIADESGEAMLTLFGRMMASALKDWVPCSTILLITKPNCWGAHSSRLSVSARTMVEVDPEGMGEGGEWLARLAGWSGRGVNERFPEGVFDVEAVEEAVTRVKFTLADIDDFIRVGPKNQIYMGYLNVLLTEVNLVTMYKANRLFSAECSCRIPLYGNTPTSRCRQCGEDVELRVNPQIIGSITDETGTISSSPHPHPHPHPFSSPSSPYKQNPPSPISHFISKKTHTPLLWSPDAWRQLFGVRELDEILGWGLGEFQAVESGLRFLRVTLLFGWDGGRCGGRLAVCRVCC